MNEALSTDQNSTLQERYIHEFFETYEKFPNDMSKLVSFFDEHVLPYLAKTDQQQLEYFLKPYRVLTTPLVVPEANKAQATQVPEQSTEDKIEDIIEKMAEKDYALALCQCSANMNDFNQFLTKLSQNPPDTLKRSFDAYNASTGNDASLLAAQRILQNEPIKAMQIPLKAPLLIKDIKKNAPRHERALYDNAEMGSKNISEHINTYVKRKERESIAQYFDHVALKQMILDGSINIEDALITDPEELKAANRAMHSVFFSWRIPKILGNANLSITKQQAKKIHSSIREMKNLYACLRNKPLAKVLKKRHIPLSTELVNHLNRAAITGNFSKIQETPFAHDITLSDIATKKELLAIQKAQQKIKGKYNASTTHFAATDIAASPEQIRKAEATIAKARKKREAGQSLFNLSSNEIEAVPEPTNIMSPQAQLLSANEFRDSIADLQRTAFDALTQYIDLRRNKKTLDEKQLLKAFHQNIERLLDYFGASGPATDPVAYEKLVAIKQGIPELLKANGAKKITELVYTPSTKLYQYYVHKYCTNELKKGKVAKHKKNPSASF